MNDEKISIIIPIYNVERYLRQCLDSVVNQTYRNLEILLIDDGSPDKCGAICDEYAGKDSRIKVLHKSNGGVHAAWNDGIEMATGEWISFVDSDDWVETSLYEKMLSSPKSEEADIIITTGYFWEESRGQFIRNAFVDPVFFENGSGKEFLQIRAMIRPKGAKTKGALSYIWSKLYRASFLRKENLKFDPAIRTGMMGDLLFNMDAYERAGTVLGLDLCGYHYRITNTSGTGKFDPDRAKKQEYIQEQLFSRVSQSINPDELRKAVESRCLRDIVHNLQHCYFHPDNPAGYKEIVKGIREMKQMPYYREAIYSKDNPYNGLGLRIFQIALKLPWIWPLKMIVNTWNLIDSREKKT